MKVMTLFPLVCLVGVDGFNLFAPYVALLFSLAYLARTVRASRQRVAYARA